jgi:hypothetical protein
LLVFCGIQWHLLIKKIGLWGFVFAKKIFFSTHSNLKHLNKPIYSLKKSQKTKMNLKLKIFTIRYISSSKEKKKKHIGETSFMKWNSLTSTLIIFMVGIIINNDYLYTRFQWDLSLLSKRKLKIKKIKFDIKIEFLII